MLKEIIINSLTIFFEPSLSLSLSFFCCANKQLIYAHKTFSGDDKFLFCCFSPFPSLFPHTFFCHSALVGTHIEWSDVHGLHTKLLAQLTNKQIPTMSNNINVGTVVNERERKRLLDTLHHILFITSQCTQVIRCIEIYIGKKRSNNTSTYRHPLPCRLVFIFLVSSVHVRLFVSRQFSFSKHLTHIWYQFIR